MHEYATLLEKWKTGCLKKVSGHPVIYQYQP